MVTRIPATAKETSADAVPEVCALGCGCALARCLGLIWQNDRQMDERQGRSKESVMAELKERFA